MYLAVVLAADQLAIVGGEAQAAHVRAVIAAGQHISEILLYHELS